MIFYENIFPLDKSTYLDDIVFPISTSETFTPPNPITHSQNKIPQNSSIVPILESVPIIRTSSRSHSQHSYL